MPTPCISTSTQWARRFCPVLRHFRAGYHWSFMQVEFATDVVFRRQAQFQPLYAAIVRTAVHVVQAEHVATFLGHKLTGNFQDEVGNDFSTRIQGTRIRHHMGPASLKLYDKFGLIARVECTVNDVTFFKHHRWVEQRNGKSVFKLAPLRKSIYSLHDLRYPDAGRQRPLPRLHGLHRQPRCRPTGAGQDGRHRPRPKAAPCAASTSSSTPTTTCSSPSRAASGTSPAFVPPTCAPTSPDSRRDAPPTS